VVRWGESEKDDNARGMRVQKFFDEPGRPEEFHLQSPTDPYVSLSTHTARASLPPVASQPQADIEQLGSSQLPG